MPETSAFVFLIRESNYQTYIPFKRPNDFKKIRVFFCHNNISNFVSNIFGSYAGLHCKVICGKAKGKDYRPSDPCGADKYQHCWNAVCVDNNWFPVDTKWAAKRKVIIIIMNMIIIAILIRRKIVPKMSYENSV